MIDRDAQRKRLDELWKSSVFEVDENDSAPTSRVERAVAHLRKYEIEFRRSIEIGDLAGAYHSSSAGRVVWTLLSIELGGWLSIDVLSEMLEGYDDNASNRQLIQRVLARYNECIPPTHRGAIDPTPILMPRSTLLMLLSGLEALERGEVQSVFTSSITGRHDEPWSWDQMRIRAVKWVAFLRGQGIAVQFARHRVGLTMKVAPGTLRKWESDLSVKDEIEVAEQAGRLKITLEDNPSFAENDGNTIDASALACLEGMQREPLSMFGQEYRKRFGRRHNQALSEGD